MQQLTLEWAAADQHLSQTVSLQQSTKNPGTIRVGRDATMCDVVIKHPDPTIEKTVSGLHIEIFFNPEHHQFYLRNLTRDRQPPKRPNPVVVDGQKVVMEEVPLHVGSQIRLGRMALQVKSIDTQPVPVEPPAVPIYQRVCGNPRTPHYHPLTYDKLNCDICGYVMQGATLVYPVAEV
ncbi:FHA domain-containing protein [Thermocoleostomius sinensis]|uniref:FHA domain-containing protein n=1 Tax=Thermocoleostomius sinensis A174 TaxID=2016057 RepID=A0A9E8ZCL6_9CYAN|nr:FHA domain-containing protein [Thermocoleostomius sinensis]WAL59367.1 FHA domain-containing protein [Thermocoleostomius sinensis A174]